ncbi:thiamine-phosphate pyrophosphorylase [Dyadobacter jejuensis]|uniref:Thiamine-phosphate synthase n=1 Tax=Dyadobacter jejuensis TaxID=1082580 RepID=A0A316APG7_9BACT|nr:thiamine phosphate synthase [Dyadobacter jejuensis]PWJ58710.1 thiamine-phosphate pyrophosphorylase [Dyadobacter jejuensis]
MIDRLHFISNQTATISHIEGIQLALQAGCRLVQLRVKDRPHQAVLELAKVAKDLCHGFEARLVINDYPTIAREVEAYGCHLGLSDMAIAQARTIVGDKMILGGTANNLHDVLKRVDEGVDYIGLGPLRYTSTKKSLSPILGFEGYQSILNSLKLLAKTTPIIAIGGIVTDDISPLRNMGIHGVALSSTILLAPDRASTVTKLYNDLC